MRITYRYLDQFIPVLVIRKDENAALIRRANNSFEEVDATRVYSSAHESCSSRLGKIRIPKPFWPKPCEYYYTIDEQNTKIVKLTACGTPQELIKIKRGIFFKTEVEARAYFDAIEFYVTQNIQKD